ncbi:hypothetical protein FPQ18DRAFT_305243 [Pyronema domesticum]|nr:hypothetical protein FPQ18DRAFT_305243 [Pyronema domesticum]
MPFSSIKRKSLPRNIIADTISTGTSDIYHSRKSTVVKKAAEGKGVNRLVRVVGPELLFPSAVSKTPRTRAKARLSLCNMMTMPYHQAPTGYPRTIYPPISVVGTSFAPDVNCGLHSLAQQVPGSQVIGITPTIVQRGLRDQTSLNNINPRLIALPPPVASVTSALDPAFASYILQTTTIAKMSDDSNHSDEQLISIFDPYTGDDSSDEDGDPRYCLGFDLYYQWWPFNGEGAGDNLTNQLLDTERGYEDLREAYDDAMSQALRARRRGAVCCEMHAAFLRAPHDEDKEDNEDEHEDGEDGKDENEDMAEDDDSADKDGNNEEDEEEKKAGTTATMLATLCWSLGTAEDSTIYPGNVYGFYYMYH